MKRTFVSTLTALLPVILLASAAYAAPAAVEVRLPFKGSLQAVETYRYDFPILYVHASGSGNATYLGQYTVSYEAVVDLVTLTGSPAAHFVAANGDSLSAVSSGRATPTDTPNVIHPIELYTITGGTGRFAGATGTFTVDRLLNVVTGVTSGTFDGTIVIHEGN